MSNPHTGIATQVSATTSVRFDGFAGLPAERNELVESEIFTCLGNKWQLDVWPGGNDDADDGVVSVYLCNMSERSINVEFCLCVKDCVEKKMNSRI